MAMSTQHIRNVALVGQAGVGTTTLAEAMLHRAGVTSRRGTVADGTTTLDRDPEAIERGSSVSIGLASFEWRAPDGATYRINVLDTPGHPDFVAETDAALSAADLAVIVVSAADGVEVGTTAAWRACAERSLPAFVFVTREDRPRADFEHVVDDLAAAFGPGFTPLELPLGEEAAFHGVADVITEQALEYEPDGTHQVVTLPTDVADHEHEVHDRVVEEIVSGDDDQLERYLEGEQLTERELERTLAREVGDRRSFPVLVGSGANGIGVDRLLDYVCEVGPSPADRTLLSDQAGELVQIGADPDEPAVAFVFKTVADQYVGRISLFRVVTGTIRPDDELVDHVSGATVRLHAPFRLVGEQHEPTDALVAGDIGAVAKVDVGARSTLHHPERPISLVVADLPAAHLATALVPRTQSDDDRLPDALQKLVQEDPSLVVEHDPLSHRTVLRTVGDTHLAVALARLEHRYDIGVDTEPVRVAYRRTITEETTAEGRVKKQSGGHGQFAVVTLRVSPLDRGGGFEFVDAVVGGAIPKQFVQATEGGVADALAGGGQLGIPVVDVRVECIDGKTHSVDSSDMAFRTAAAQAFQEAVESAGPVILEPIARLEVVVPAETQGDVLGDLGARRGRIVDSRADGDQQTIVAEVPLAEIQRYSMDLRSLTGGRGGYTIGDVHHEVLPDHLVTDVIAQYTG